MAKDVGQAHGLHQLMRSWLLAEDPYGMNQMPRTEPTLDTNPRSGRAKAAGTEAVANALTPDPRAAEAGPQAVEQQLFGGQGARYSEAERDPRAQAWGEKAVGQATAPSPSAEVDRTRGQAWGEQAVDKALNPPMGSGAGFWAPGEAADTASAVGQSAVAGALPDEAARRAAMEEALGGFRQKLEGGAAKQALRTTGVGRAQPLAMVPPTGEAIRSRAKSRLKDPQDPDERQPE